MQQSPSGDGSKAPRPQAPINIFRRLLLGRNALNLCIILLLLSALYYLHTSPALSKSTILSSATDKINNNNDAEDELASCKLHLSLAERAAKSAADSAARTNQVLESLAGAKVRDGGASRLRGPIFSEYRGSEARLTALTRNEELRRSTYRAGFAVVHAGHCTCLCAGRCIEPDLLLFT